MGIECPIKKQCLHYTRDGKRTMRKCTNGKRFLQDQNKVNKDSLRK